MWIRDIVVLCMEALVSYSNPYFTHLKSNKIYIRIIIHITQINQTLHTILEEINLFIYSHSNIHSCYSQRLTEQINRKWLWRHHLKLWLFYLERTSPCCVTSVGFPVQKSHGYIQNLTARKRTVCIVEDFKLFALFHKQK